MKFKWKGLKLNAFVEGVIESENKDEAMFALKKDGVIVVPMHPGWVKTEMAGDVADIEPSESADGIRQVISSMTIADTGTFLKWDGDIHSW